MIVAVMGVSGSGKTTVGGRLAEALGTAFLDADALHPPSNIEKLRRGIPLTDEDRAPWLSAIGARIAVAAAHGDDLVLACSALKAAYRAMLAGGAPIHWVYLNASPELIQERLRHRTGHFMAPTLLASQFEILEEPRDAIVADASLPPETIVRQVVEHLPAGGEKGQRACRSE